MGVQLEDFGFSRAAAKPTSFEYVIVGGGGGSGHAHSNCGGRSGSGGGGGGVYSCDCNNWEGCHGGSGIVIIRWSTAFAPATSTSMSGAVSYNNGAGGYHQYTFTGTAQITSTGAGDSGSLVI